MISTLFAAGLLLLPSANAFFRLPCAKPVVNSRIDPIVNPGVPSSHSHTIMGASGIGFNSTFESLRASECSTCKVKDDKSAYWAPELFYQHKNGSFEAVQHGGALVYYLQRFATGETVQAFPDGLRMIAGNPYARSDLGTDESKGISWLCIDFNGPAVPQTKGFTNTNCPDGLRAQIFFPSCWDGVNLDSPDHKSHMAYPDGIDNGRCPPSHPHHLISIFYELWFSVKPFNQMNDGGRLVLSNGDPTGYGLHGDFMNGWDQSVLSRAVATCTAQSGVIEDCPVFQNEGRFYTDDQNNACSAPNPLPQEKVDPGNLLANLPGCVAVTEGPANATAADKVPGCVAGGGSGTPVPISGMPSGAASSSASAPSSSSKPAGSAPAMPSASPSNAAAKNAPAPASSSASTPSSASKPAGAAPPAMPSASQSNTPANNAALAASSSPKPPPPSTPSANQLAASTGKMPASTFTTNLAAASSIMKGASPVPMPAASPSPSSAKDDYGYEHCGRDYDYDERDMEEYFAHRRRSRMQRRRGLHGANN